LRLWLRYPTKTVIDGEIVALDESRPAGSPADVALKTRLKELLGDVA
jgi:hypothetical protein